MKSNNYKSSLPKKVKVKLVGNFNDNRGQILNITNYLFRSCAIIK